VKPELQATSSPATASQSLALEGSARAGLWLSDQAGTSPTIVINRFLTGLISACHADTGTQNNTMFVQVFETFSALHDF